MFPVLETRFPSIISLLSFFNTVLTLIVPNLNSSPSETDNIISKLVHKNMQEEQNEYLNAV